MHGRSQVAVRADGDGAAYFKRQVRAFDDNRGRNGCDLGAGGADGLYAREDGKRNAEHGRDNRLGRGAEIRAQERRGGDICSREAAVRAV